MSECCNEYGCKRKKPVMLMRSDLTETWYVVTDYTKRGEGQFTAKVKHRLADNQQQQLEDMREELGAALKLLDEAYREDCGLSVWHQDDPVLQRLVDDIKRREEERLSE